MKQVLTHRFCCLCILNIVYLFGSLTAVFNDLPVKVYVKVFLNMSIILSSSPQNFFWAKELVLNARTIHACNSLIFQHQYPIFNFSLAATVSQLILSNGLLTSSIYNEIKIGFSFMANAVFLIHLYVSSLPRVQLFVADVFWMCYSFEVFSNCPDWPCSFWLYFTVKNTIFPRT